MRNISLLPLAALLAVAAGCGTEVKEQTSSSVPQRDLTLVTQTAQVEVASPLETQLLRTPSRSVHRSRMAARLAPAAAPKPVVAAPQPVVQPVPAAPAATPTSNRELPPGKTVTLIPVSSGPSIGTDKTAEFPGERGHTVRAHGGGGTCRGGGRGPDIGMAPAPRPDFR
jgi:hypothetical protein